MTSAVNRSPAQFQRTRVRGTPGRPALRIHAGFTAATDPAYGACIQRLSERARPRRSRRARWRCVNHVNDRRRSTMLAVRFCVRRVCKSRDRGRVQPQSPELGSALLSGSHAAFAFMRATPCSPSCRFSAGDTRRVAGWLGNCRCAVAAPSAPVSLPRVL
jgi:hypothetical protein